MSTTRPSRLSSFLTYCMFGCFGGCPFAFYEGEKLTGWGLLLTAMLLRITLMVETRLDTIEAKVPEPAPAPAHADELDKYGEDTHHLNLTTPELKEQYGWHNVTVYTLPFPHYVRQRCWGGPPVTYETWEYDFKWGGDFLFHRLAR